MAVALPHGTHLLRLNIMTILSVLLMECNNVSASRPVVLLM